MPPLVEANILTASSRRPSDPKETVVIVPWWPRARNGFHRTQVRIIAIRDLYADGVKCAVVHEIDECLEVLSEDPWPSPVMLGLHVIVGNPRSHRREVIVLCPSDKHRDVVPRCRSLTG